MTRASRAERLWREEVEDRPGRALVICDGRSAVLDAADPAAVDVLVALVLGGEFPYVAGPAHVDLFDAAMEKVRAEWDAQRRGASREPNIAEVRRALTGEA